MITLKQKKGWLIRDFVIAGILCGLVLALFVLGLAGINNNYSNIPDVNKNVVNADFAAHYSTIDAQLTKVDSMYKSVKGGDGFSLIGTFDVAFNSVFTVIALIWQTLTLYTGMGKWIPQDFTFLSTEPLSLFISGVLAIMTIYLVMVWLSSIMRGKI